MTTELLIMLLSVFEGLQHTQLREEVSLLEEAPVTAMKQYSSSSSSAVNRESDQWNGLPIEDDTIVMIDRLQDITKKALQLQVRVLLLLSLFSFNTSYIKLRLRDEYMQRQRSIQVDCSETLTVGQMGIVRVSLHTILNYDGIKDNLM